MPPEYVDTRSSSALPDVDQLAEIGQPTFGVDLRQAVEAALQPQHLETGLLRVERGLLQGDADAQSHLVGLGRDVEARNAGAARRWGR